MPCSQAAPRTRSPSSCSCLLQTTRQAASSRAFPRLPCVPHPRSLLWALKRPLSPSRCLEVAPGDYKGPLKRRRANKNAEHIVECDGIPFKGNDHIHLEENRLIYLIEVAWRPLAVGLDDSAAADLGVLQLMRWPNAPGLFRLASWSVL
jgi:hypothetical protein